MVESGRHLGEGLAQSLLEERHLAHSEVLRETCRRVGARDPDDLWDQLYELDHDHRDTARFFQDVLGVLRTGPPRLHAGDAPARRLCRPRGGHGRGGGRGGRPGRRRHGRVPHRRLARASPRPCPDAGRGGPEGRAGDPDALWLRAARPAERLRQRHAGARVLPADVGGKAGHRPDRRAGPRGAETEHRSLGRRRDRGARAGAAGWQPCAGIPGRRARTCWTASARCTSKVPTIWRACRSSPWPESSWPAIGWETYLPRPAFLPWSRTSGGPRRGSRSSWTGSMPARFPSTSTATPAPVSSAGSSTACGSWLSRSPSGWPGPIT